MLKSVAVAAVIASAAGAFQCVITSAHVDSSGMSTCCMSARERSFSEIEVKVFVLIAPECTRTVSRLRAE